MNSNIKPPLQDTVKSTEANTRNSKFKKEDNYHAEESDDEFDLEYEQNRHLHEPKRRTTTKFRFSKGKAIDEETNKVFKVLSTKILEQRKK